jgi:3-oxoacyl-[acyl-carrier-protein] synthase-3
MGAAITGWGAHVPAPALTNKELAERFGVTEEWIVQRTGIHSRRIAPPDETTSSLAIAASREAVDRAGIDAADLDLVILATCTPDHAVPAAAPLVQHAIGARRAGAIDVNAVCAGFVYGLAQAVAFVDSGMAKKVLVCGADVFTRVIDQDDLASVILFGDGAGAVIVEDLPGPSRFTGTTLRSDGSTRDLLYIPQGAGVVCMRGREIYRHAVEWLGEASADAVAASNLVLDDIDLLVAHQANRRIVDAVAQRMELPQERVMHNIAELGNTSAASVPLALYDAAQAGRLDQGDRVLLTAIGGGLVWGATVMEWAVGGPDRTDGLGEVEVADV